MKLGISTLGCPDWTLAQILERVKSYGYTGVEMRGLGPDVDLTQSPAFATREAAAETKQAFAAAGLEIISIDTTARFTDPAQTEAGMTEAQKGIDLAVQMGASFVRVFPGSFPETVTRTAAVRSLAECLATLGDYAEKSGDVCVVLETHDSFSTGRQVADALEQAGHVRAGALWDMNHPYRQGEAPGESYAALAPFLKLVHVKDGTAASGYTLLGEGDVPVREILGLLKRGGYDGYVNLEWEKRWAPTIADPLVAFPQYEAKLREYLAE